MSTPRTLCMALFFVFSIPSGKGQNLEHWFEPEHIEILNKMKLKYRKPTGFSERKHLECFGENRKLHFAFRCLSNRIDAKDGEMVLFLAIHSDFEATRFIRTKKEFPSHGGGDFNQYHIAQIKAIIYHIRGPSYRNRWREGVCHF